MAFQLTAWEHQLQYLLRLFTTLSLASGYIYLAVCQEGTLVEKQNLITMLDLRKVAALCLTFQTDCKRVVWF